MDLGVQIEPQFGFSYDAVRDIARAANSAGFMLATLTVTGRHMMFRLTAEEDE